MKVQFCRQDLFFLKLFFTVILCAVCVSEPPDSHFYPSENDEDYNFPKYPFQQYIQVRKTVSVEHVPTYESSGGNKRKADSLEQSASHDVSSSPSGSATSHQGEEDKDNHHHYYKPPLKEEIFVKKKQEVYEERGYHDGHYDHSSHGEHYGENHNGHGQNNYKQPYETSASASSPKRHHNIHGQGYGGNYRKHVLKKKPVGSEEGSSTKLLEHIASNYDPTAHEVGFYQAKSHIYCPEVIDFDLSSKSQKMGVGARPKGKRRLNGLGSKIDCLKRKYFGNEPRLLPSTVFMDPAESKRSVIKMGTINQFWDDIKKNFH